MLIVFARFPEPGKTKTRLIPATGEVAAADIQHRMSLRTLEIATKFGREEKVDVEIRYTGATGEEMAALYGTDLRFRLQGDGNLGQRLDRAITEGFLTGARMVLVIGTDCPALSADQLRSARDALAEADVVLGPAVDGGYYLIGLRQPHAELFDGIAWSTARVLQQTLDVASRLGLSTHLLELLADIDRPEDLQHLPPM
jgi:rSAM/selenodomain-associated transferase 1